MCSAHIADPEPCHTRPTCSPASVSLRRARLFFRDARVATVEVKAAALKLTEFEVAKYNRGDRAGVAEPGRRTRLRTWWAERSVGVQIPPPAHHSRVIGGRRL